MVFVGRVPSVYDTWEEALVQVHQFFGVDHRAKVAFMKFWQIDCGNIQEGFSSSTYPTHCCSSSSTSSTEEIPYCTEDVKYKILKYQLNIAIKQKNHAMKIAKMNTKIFYRYQKARCINTYRYSSLGCFGHYCGTVFREWNCHCHKLSRLCWSPSKQGKNPLKRTTCLLSIERAIQ